MVGKLVKEFLRERRSLLLQVLEEFEQYRLGKWIRRGIILSSPEEKTAKQVFVAGEYVDDELKKIEEAKRREWRARGLTDTQIEMALTLARNWASSMAEFAAPGMYDIQKKIVPSLFRRGLEEVSEAWIKAMFV